MWDVKNDVFHFEPVIDFVDVYTKTTMLSIIASIFDPLAFVRHIPISGLMLFQEANRMKIDWKQALPGELDDIWIAWLYSLEELSSIKFVRCMKPAPFSDAHLELQVFSDASQNTHTYTHCY